MGIDNRNAHNVSTVEEKQKLKSPETGNVEARVDLKTNMESRKYSMEQLKNLEDLTTSTEKVLSLVKIENKDDFRTPEMLGTLSSARKTMKEMDTNPVLFKVIDGEISSFMTEPDRNIQLDNLNRLSKLLLSYIEGAKLMYAKKEVANADTPVEKKEVKKQALEDYMPYLKNGLEKIPEVGTDSLNRAESMRHVYSSLPNGSDQILLQTAIKEVFSSNRFEMSEGYQGMLDNVENIKTSDVPYIIAAYQQLKYLKPDGKFGPNTFAALKKDAGVKILDVNTGEEAVSKTVKSRNVDNYIDRVKREPKKKVEEEGIVLEDTVIYGDVSNVPDEDIGGNQLDGGMSMVQEDIGGNQLDSGMSMPQEEETDGSQLEGGMSEMPEEQDMGSSEQIESEDMNQDMYGPDLPPEMSEYQDESEQKDMSSIDDVE